MLLDLSADALGGLQWHVIAMYAPSFFTGNLIGRFGAGRVATVGLLSAYGWNTVLWVSFVPLALSVVALALAKRRKSLAVA